MPVHPARNDASASVEDRFGELGRCRDGPWLAHRLDRDTAGCLVVALRRSALRAAQACFAEGGAEKTYWAAVLGVPRGVEGEIRSRLGRVQHGGSWRMAPTEDGRIAITSWRLLGNDGAVAWLALNPVTGRTHQIRVHCAAIGCPILGDGVYGIPAPGGLQLLSRSIGLPLCPRVDAIAPVPSHMRAALVGCGWQEGGGSAPGPAGGRAPRPA